jgi:hypothetical protein
MDVWDVIRTPGRMFVRDVATEQLRGQLVFRF